MAAGAPGPLHGITGLNCNRRWEEKEAAVANRDRHSSSLRAYQRDDGSAADEKSEFDVRFHGQLVLVS
jgi:hypothetical protein